MNGYSQSNLAQACLKQAKYDEALSLLSQVHQVRRDRDPQAADTALAQSNLASVLFDMGRLEEAERGFRGAIQVAEIAHGTHHWRAAVVRANLGSVLVRLDRFDEAERSALAAYEDLSTAFGETHWRAQSVVRTIVRLYTRWHKPERIAKWRAKLPATERAASLIELGMRLLEDGRHGEAEAALSACPEIRRESSTEGHWLIFNTMSVLGECIAGATASSSEKPADPALALGARIEKLREAEALLLEGYEGLTAAAETIPESTRDQRLRQAIQRIVNLYEAWHAAETDDEGEHGRDAHATTNAHATKADHAQKAAEWRSRQAPPTQPSR